MGRAQRATLFMVLLAGFKVVLARYAGTQDVLVGAPIAGRVRPEVEGLIGFFVNTLVLRTDCSGDPTFGELLGRVRQIAWEAYAHQDLPFDQLVEELYPPRDLSRNPVVQIDLPYGGTCRGWHAGARGLERCSAGRLTGPRPLRPLGPAHGERRQRAPGPDCL